MPAKLSETPLLDELTHYSPEQARTRLRELEDPVDFDQTDPALAAAKRVLTLQAQERP